MRTAENLMRELIRSPSWPSRWMTVVEIEAELERLGFWKQPALLACMGPNRLDFLARVLPDTGHCENSTWARMGTLFKPAALLTEEDRVRCEEYRVALDEDLTRILLGTGPARRTRPASQALAFKEFLRQGRPLVEELTRLTHRLEGNGEPRVPPATRRVRELVSSLTELFEDQAEAARAA